MNVVRKYDIAYKGLSEGRHRFGFDVDNGFFDAFANPEIKGGSATVDVQLEKLPSSLRLDFTIKGSVTVECDRCLEELTLPVDYTGTLTVKFTDEKLSAEEKYDGDVLWLGYGEGVLNVAQYIYESIVLSLPYQRVHPEDENGTPGCDPEMLGRFGIITQEDFDRLAQPEQQVMADNPEWEKLRKLKEEL